MTNEQSDFIKRRVAPPNWRGTKPKGVKNHRVCYLMPTWMEKGLHSAAHYFRETHGVELCRRIIAEQRHPRALEDLCRGALALNQEGL